MSPAVEARSLSSLTTLAANPPRYPRNPTLKIQEPLVLYIARVPGSRGETDSPSTDVFLTTLKPREKVVTVEDIQSSLYYLHVDNSEDDTFLRDSNIAKDPQEIGGEPETRDRDVEARTEVHRKALPQKPPDEYACGTHPKPPPEISPYSQPGHLGLGDIEPPRRKPLNGAAPTKEDELRRQSTGAPVPSLSGHLLGPRPFHPRLHSLDSGKPLAEKESVDTPSRRWSAQSTVHIRKPPMPPRTEFQRKQVLNDHLGINDITQVHPSLHRQGSNSLGGEATTDELSFTLIRRDPASGGQWNVGKISSAPSEERYSDSWDTAQNMTMKGLRRPIHIEVRTPGYGKFNSAISQVSIDKGEAIQGNGRRSVFANSSEFQDDRVFRRRLFYERSNSAQHKSRKQRPGSSDMSIGSEVSWQSFDTRPIRDPQGSAETLDHTFAGDNADSASAKTKANPRGYTFLSPWNGPCEFSTGIAGRSLKCKHSLPAGAAATSSSPPVTVSEFCTLQWTGTQGINTSFFSRAKQVILSSSSQAQQTAFFWL
ncbi:MAG: hypothetical protein M1830_003996 [Pleopsidium flavum]|nr:MAG: hypothetical protein M1830_003996 [Pleopsidium flavum]